ncbi:MAG TPA: DsbA family protein [Geminicoccus sp.]|uniref:DsbA family protein n=1 Tax=Geminicoccus sp. TaxID=2024832 RepID=UPI002D13B5BF|nr:DsbA family protein [Geminicoccus sp.]HWL70358.1 DsbA family protein [Geminicoccus sp.]
MRIRPAILAGLLLLAAPPLLAEETPPIDRAAVEQVVRELLQREPELVMEALQSLQARQEAEQAQQAQQAVADNAEALKGEPAEVAANPDGDVTLVEFMDYHCGYCRRMMPTLRDLVGKDKGVRFVLKEFPILGPDSVVAARAAVAARNQGRYWDMHLALMESEDISLDGVRAVAAGLGLDVARLEADMNSPQTEQVLAADMELARKLGLRGTPAFVLGGEIIPGAVPPDQLEDLIAATRERS